MISSSIVHDLQTGLCNSRQKGDCKGRLAPLPEREVSSHSPLLAAAAGGKKEHWNALDLHTHRIKREDGFAGKAILPFYAVSNIF
jgi:hypothetical protein